MMPLIRKMTTADWAFVANIYLEGINTGHATFETEVPSWEKWDRTHLSNCRWVAEVDKEVDKEVAGWAALSAVSSRCVYEGVAETSIYIGSKFRGLGIGSALMIKVIEDSEENNIWTLKAGIFPENKTSIYLHEKNGFRILGTQIKIGKMHGKWRDVVLMERRSKVAGIG